MNTTLEEKKNKASLLNKCWTYLNENFHKFNEDNKIKIALELSKKNMPTILEGELNQNIIHMPAVKIEDKPLETEIGS